MPKTVRFHETGGPEVLRWEDVPAPALKAGEVRLKVQAVGLNRAEVMFREGKYIENPVLPSLIGYEAAGLVEEVGANVDQFTPGDRVSSIPCFSMRDFGTYGESVVLPAFALSQYPTGLSPVEGASIWMQYLTAFGLVEVGGMASGQRVLITAAASSVGLAAIQLANLVGAVPIATTRKKDKEQALRAAGAQEVINTKEDDLAARVREITSGKGVDLAFDAVAGPELEKVAAATRPEGMVMVYGALSPEPTPFPLFAALGGNLVIRGYTLHTIVGTPERLARAKAFVLQGLESGGLKPIIARTFPLAAVVDAHRFMETSEQVGKIVLVASEG